MTVQNKPLSSSASARIGFLTPGHIERAFVVVLYGALLLLVLLSVLGTFYGLVGKEAPIRSPLSMAQDSIEAFGRFALAFLVQLVLTVVQYGARQLTERDRRWWMLYLIALGVSVYYNIQAYLVPLSALLGWYVAWPLIVAGDIVPEFIAVRRD